MIGHVGVETGEGRCLDATAIAETREELAVIDREAPESRFRKPGATAILAHAAEYLI
jgi:hypothetical protein